MFLDNGFEDILNVCDGISNLVDKIGDRLHTSKFYKIKNEWNRLSGHSLTRKVYNANKGEILELVEPKLLSVNPRTGTEFNSNDSPSDSFKKNYQSQTREPAELAGRAADERAEKMIGASKRYGLQSRYLNL